MDTRGEPPSLHRPDPIGEGGARTGRLGTFVFLAILVLLGLGLLFATGHLGSVEELADKALPWIDSALEATGDTFEPAPAGERERAPRTAVLDSGEVVVGDFEIIPIEEIWASGDVEGTMRVAIEKNPEWLRRLLHQEGVDPNLRLTFGEEDSGWEHPLEKAARQGSRETFEILLAAGADPDGHGSSGETALHAAATKGNLGIIEELVARGADPDLLTGGGLLDREVAGRSAELGQAYEPGVGAAVIERAAGQGHADVVAFLLEAGAAPRYALHAAARRGSIEIMRLLLDHGADSPGRARSRHRVVRR